MYTLNCILADEQPPGRNAKIRPLSNFIINFMIHCIGPLVCQNYSLLHVYVVIRLTCQIMKIFNYKWQAISTGLKVKKRLNKRLEPGQCSFIKSATVFSIRWRWKLSGFLQVPKHVLAEGPFTFIVLPLHDSIMEEMIFSYDHKQLMRFVQWNLPNSVIKSLK